MGSGASSCLLSALLALGLSACGEMIREREGHDFGRSALNADSTVILHCLERGIVSTARAIQPFSAEGCDIDRLMPLRISHALPVFRLVPECDHRLVHLTVEGARVSQVRGIAEDGSFGFDFYLPVYFESNFARIGCAPRYRVHLGGTVTCRTGSGDGVIEVKVESEWVEEADTVYDRCPRTSPCRFKTTASLSCR